MATNKRIRQSQGVGRFISIGKSHAQFVFGNKGVGVGIPVPDLKVTRLARKGFPPTWTTKEPVIPELGQSFVVRIPLRGRSQSDRPKMPGQGTTAQTWQE